jgi:uncharacterized protein YbaA (DUF1428 family)
MQLAQDKDQNESERCAAASASSVFREHDWDRYVRACTVDISNGHAYRRPSALGSL